MTVERSTSWTHEEDVVLKNIVIDYIKSGKPQTAAFNEASNKLGRTPLACAFHFNNKIRGKVKREIDEAKKISLTLKQQKQKKSNTEVLVRDETIPVEEPKVEVMPKSEVTLDSIMKDIQSLVNKSPYEEGEREALLEENMLLRNENAELRVKAKENDELKAKLNEFAIVFEKLKGLNI